MSAGGAPPLVVLASGEGTNFQALVDACHDGRLAARPHALLTDRADAPALERARRAGIGHHCIDRRAYATRADHDAALAEAIAACGPDALVVLAGYMRIISASTVDALRGRILNIHPSLLPAHRGLHTHRRVLEAGDIQHGATVHFVTPELDAGPAVVQYRLAVQPWDDEPALAARVRSAEHLIYPYAVDLVASGRVHLEGDTVELDGRPLSAPLVLTYDLLGAA